MNTFLKAIGLGSMKDLFERLGLIILGFVLVIVGIKMLSDGSGGSSSGQASASKPAEEEEPVDEYGETEPDEKLTPALRRKASKASRATKTVSSDEAMEAAAVA
jgi:hypothetical protein